MENQEYKQEYKNMEPNFEDRFRERRRQHMQKYGRPNNVLGGLILVAIGVVYLINQIDSTWIPDYLFRWYTILIAVGLFVGAKHNFRGGGWLIPIIIGGYFLMTNNNILPREFQRFAIPAGIIILGLFVMVRSKKNREFYNCVTEGVSDEDVLDITNIFGGSKRTVLSKSFKGGKISSVFGGVDINLTQADFEGTIYMDIENVFGGTKLLVPANWEVKVETANVFGGVNDKRPVIPVSDAPSKILIIKGTCVFGGIDIKSY